MKAAEKMALVETILTRAAEQIGDVTAPAMACYYQRLPAAKAAFNEHCLGNLPQLEGLMVENSLHGLMYWFESPAAIEIWLSGSVLHHHDTLHIPTEWYSELIDATAEVIAQTIPPESKLELAVWNELRSGLRGVVETCRQYVSVSGSRCRTQAS
jgi:hypothetical protein